MSQEKGVINQLGGEVIDFNPSNTWSIGFNNFIEPAQEEETTKEDSQPAEVESIENLDQLEDGSAQITDDPLSKVEVPIGSDTTDESELTVDNPIFYLAQQAKKEGFISLEDIKEDITLEDVYNNYFESIKPTVEQKALEEVQQKLANAGIREEHLLLLQAMENGVPEDELYAVDKFRKYSSLGTDSADEAKITVIKDWYKSRNLTEKEINRNIEAIEVEDTVDAEFEEAKEFFKKEVSAFESEQMRIALERDQERAVIQKRNNEILTSIKKDLKLLDDKITKDQADTILSGISNKETFNIQGQDYVMSPYENYIYRLNNDLEFSLMNFKRFMFRDQEMEKQKVVGKVEGDSSFLDAYKKVVKKDSSKSSIMKGEIEEGIPFKTNNGYYMEFGGGNK